MTTLGVFVGLYADQVRDFEKWVGKPVEAVHAFTGGGISGDWNGPDPGWQLNMQQYLGGAGRPIIWSIPMTPDDGGAAALREVATGSKNDLYKGWAQKILASRQGDDDPIYVRTTWELGGEWFPWTQAAKDDPEAYKAAFGQFAKSFHEVSGRFKMVWDFNSDRGPVEQWYPGDEAVDVIAQDIYWTPSLQGDDPVAAFNQSVNGYSRGLAWMTEFAAQHGKPMAIPEWGVPGDAADTHDGAKWIELMENWIETHNVAYASYWNDIEGSGFHGKLSDNEPAASAARLKALFQEGFDGGGSVTPPPEPPSDPVTLSAGSGPDTLVLKVSQDAYQGSAQYTVSVDGVQIGGAFTASASHAAGQSDTLTLKGDWAAGVHQVSVDFLNDKWDGTAAADRNLHLDGATYNGAALDGAAKALMSAGPVNFSFTEAASANLALQGTAAADSLTGGPGADRLRGMAGNDTLSGGAGNDALNGGAGADALNGGAGNDYLLGGAGADTLTGGAGPDRFALLTAAEGGDTILDFNVAEGDRLDLRGVFEASGQNYAKLSAGGFAKASAVSGGVQISVDADGGGNGYVAAVTLKGLTLAGLGSDFLIA